MIISFIAVFIGFFLLAYLIRLLRKHFYSLAENSVSLVNTLLLKIDEDEKVKLVQKDNTRLIVSLGKVLFSILLALIVCSLPIALYIMWEGISYEEFNLGSTSSIIALTLGSTLGFLVPLKKKATEGYSELSQLLHRLSLNNYAVSYKLFRLESKNIKKQGLSEKTQFVIVSGLARAGTTSLMNKLADDSRFASLSYANMPFLTAPKLWSKFYKPKSEEKKERSHKDGIMIGLDSTEALEEYFFKMISNDAFIQEDAILKYELSGQDYTDYLNYQTVVRAEDDRVYLAKNNNFLIRYESLRLYNPDFLVAFMFREPLSHAASLMEKHKEYSASQKDDEFILEYMDWLGHHEFGLNQKPFQFTENPPDYTEDKDSLDYWLQIWINYYSYLLRIDRTNVLFVDYEQYCQQPKQVLETIYAKIGLKPELPELIPFHNKRKKDWECSEELKEKAYQLYEALKEVA